MFPKQLLKDYLVFTRKDRIGAVLIVAVIGGSLFLPRFLAPAPQAIFIEKDTALVLSLDTLQQRQVQKTFTAREENHTAYPFERSSSPSYTKGELFPFDPNTLTAADWQRLGLKERTARTILNYISKGGRFYKPTDLQKIWGLPEGFYHRVKDYIRLPEKRKNSLPHHENKPAFVREERKPTLININEADTAAFIALPGIGGKLSARIISFREKLGGFYSVEQVGETYGLPDSTF
ncbi:MAG TPA: helix-hairpin-helix domain-containing protein, partial [Flavisolibacter sp.]